MTLLFDNKLYTAPLSEDIHNVLDVGTGTGKKLTHVIEREHLLTRITYRALGNVSLLQSLRFGPSPNVTELTGPPPTYSDFADEFPNCHVIGTDISPIQETWVPPNLTFNIDDATKEWVFKPDFFDYIHIRWLCGTIKDWASLYKDAYRCTKPGGWIEHLDCDIHLICNDGTMPEDCATSQWGKIWTEVQNKTGVQCDMVKSGVMEDGIREAGFTNIQIQDYMVSFQVNLVTAYHIIREPFEENASIFGTAKLHLPDRQQYQHYLDVRETHTDFLFLRPHALLGPRTTKNRGRSACTSAPS